METCSDKECRYLIDEYDKQNDMWDHYSFCKKHNKFIPEEVPCESYLKSQSCYNCKLANKIIYETGTIDCIDYHCNLQDNKLIFSDTHWATNNLGNSPDCPIHKWEIKQ
jgi:hypothetical protein